MITSFFRASAIVGILFFVVAPATFAQPGSHDATFAAATMNGYVKTMTLQADQRVLVGGTFTQCNGSSARGIARLNVDGSLDATFNAAVEPGDRISRGVQAIAVQSDGRILVGGNFNSVNRPPWPALARLNADGSLDATYAASPGSNAVVYAIQVLADGRALVGGRFGMFGGTPHAGIVRLNADGSVDESFQTQIESGPYMFVEQIVLAPDGRIYISGFMGTVNGVRRVLLARLHADGSLDESFDEGHAAYGGKLVLQPDGKLLVAGGGASRMLNLVRLNPDGSEDLTFQSPICDPPTDPSVDAIALQPDGQIIFGGHALFCAPFPHSVNRVNPNGTKDETFVPWPFIAEYGRSIVDIKLQPDGQILVAYNRATEASGPGGGVFRLNGDPPVSGIEFTTAYFSVSETGRLAKVTVRRGDPAKRAALVRLDVEMGTATPRRDYVAHSQLIVFPRGKRSLTIPILIRDDSLAEDDETILLRLHRPIGGELGPRRNAVLWIRDDDRPPPD